MGSPYVPTKQKELLFFLKEAGIKKGQVFIELGCGDGRVVRAAVREYGARGFGLDINPLLIWWARLRTWFAGVRNIEYRTQNIFNADIAQADIVYLFLMPELIAKLSDKLNRELKEGSLVISHGFKVKGWEPYLEKTISHKPFPTYYYRIKKTS